jgi:CubicO group peptidase (beta-lactamase class C family)
LPRLPGDLFSGKGFQADNPYKIYDAKRLYHFLKGFKTTRIPGTNFEYSNLGVGLLGQIIADQNHSTYENLLQERIVTPLGMKSTSLSLSAAAKTRFVQGHDESGSAVSAWDFQALAGAGGIRSTVNDMLLFLKANMDKAPSPLQEAMNLCKQLSFESADTKVGLGWFKSTRFNQAWWHNGMTGGYASFAMIDLERQLGVIILSNSAVNVDALGLDLMKN